MRRASPPIMPWIVTPSLLNRRSEFYYQLGTLLSAGVPVIGALESTARSSRHFRSQLLQCADLLKQGSTLIDAFRSIPDWLPQFDLSLLAAGETSGRLPQCARMLSEYYDEQARLQRQASSLMLYPLAILHVAILVFPVAAITQLAKDWNFVTFLWPKIAALGGLYAVIFFFLFAMQENRAAFWRNIWESVMGSIPLIGTARHHLALARFCASLEALVNAGVGVANGWRMAASASGSFRLTRAVESMIPSIESGQPPSELLGDVAAFPELFVSSYSSGEISGQIDDALRRLYVYYQESATRKMRMVAKAIPWTIYGIVMLVIAVSVISFWTNYFGNIMNSF